MRATDFLEYRAGRNAQNDMLEHVTMKPDDAWDLATGEEMTWDPARIALPGPWTGHIPFAYWLVKTLRPANFVELGTHSGNSYFAFCQAIAAFCPGARAYAVDTWEGDDHAGHYGQAVHDDVARFNQAHFAQFSTLVRSHFDTARGYFADGSVDLLHIDGLHTYEAVRHDFDTWLPALSPRGVVVLHDVNVRERDFGVWRLWEELRATHPGFAFHHSHGLGVLGVGRDLPEGLRALFALDPERAGQFRRRIAARGEAFQRQAEILALRAEIAAKDGHIASLTARLAAEDVPSPAGAEAEWLRALVASMRDTIAAKDTMVHSLGELAAARGAALAVRDRMIDARDALAMRLAAETGVRLQEQGRAYEAVVADLRGELARLRHDPDAQGDAGGPPDDAVQRAVDAVTQRYVTSTSWRITRPLRVAMRLVREGRLRPAPAAIVAAPPALPAPDRAPPVAVEAEPAPEQTGVAPPAKAALRAGLSARLDAFLATSAMLSLPQAAQPEVSIILVLHNQAELTFGCLGSIAETLGSGTPPVEVVILDNASSDRTASLLDRIEGATVIRSATNLHFLRGVNRAARSARGRALLLLNNDAQLLPGAVAAAVRTLDSAPDIGAVGGRIILPDGTLQEAGSIVWRNGAASGYGRGQDPNGADVMFQRDVDYCSGAFLMTPAAVWAELDGFDEAFAPAYYEETDYCVRLWESGRRVVFDPDVAVLHYEFGSAGESAEALALQQQNHRVFAERHRTWLEGQFELDPQNVIAARTARSQRKRVLVIEDRVPKTELGTGYPRSNRLLHELVAAGAEVALFPVHRHAETWRSVRRALDKRIEVLISADGSQIPQYLEARRGHFDAVIVCRPPNMAMFEEAVGQRRDLIGLAKVVYDAEALFVSRELQRREAKGDPATADERHTMVAEEVTLARRADAVLSVSEAERDTLEAYGARDVRVLSYAVDEPPIGTGFDARDRIVFLGAIQEEDAPNAIAVRWFAREILPGVRRRLGEDMRLTVIGMNRARSVAALDGSALDLRGMVENLHDALADARVMVVPSRIGAGIPLKVHQAAALGIPMVTTRLIADQVGWEDGQELLVADEPAAFAAACARLYTDRALWERLRARALERVREDCAPEVFATRVRELLDAVPITRRRAAASPPQEPQAAHPAEPPTSRPEESDFAVEVPFGFPPAAAPAPRIAVVCHLFHPEIGAELRGYLRHLPAGADLFLSTDTDEKAAAIRATFAGWDSGRLELRVMPNRGRDIAPKLVGFADAHQGHDLVLHLHSKKSDHAAFLKPWRGFLFESLMGSPAVVASILDAFARLPRLGMVAPQHYEAVRRWLGWNGNFETARALAARMGLQIAPDRALDFPSGSMFWARPAALRPLLDLGLAFEDFPEEGGQEDNTPAHAIERLYFLACERSGHFWMKVAQPALHADTRAIVPVRTTLELDRFVAEHVVSLTGPAVLKVRAEPAPMATRVPPGLAQRLAGRGF
jgi:GT2 family glycosyltransferase